MKLVILILVVLSSAFGMRREDCNENHAESIRSFFEGMFTFPLHVPQIVGAIKNADDWQICEHDLLPRICVLDFMYGKILNNYRSITGFETDLKKIAYVAKELEEKCNTRNIAPGLLNNL